MSVSPLISASELAVRLDDPTLRIADVRWVLGSPGKGREAYETGHIPGAIFLDVDSDLVAADGPGRHPLPSPKAFRERLEAAGFGTEHDIVAYDDVGGWVAARLWWMLDDLGHQRAFVLDGGYPAWEAVGGSITTAVPAFPRARLELAERWSNVIDLDGVVDRLGELVLLDARGAPRYRGETEPIDAVAGHIPTARNVPTAGNLDADGRVLAADALRARFEGLGAGATAGPVVTSCGSGVAACFTSLAMRVAGLPDPVLYPGSYSDWTQQHMPIATGPEPGVPTAELAASRSRR
jgi:thiosulfate/3-mercaptopyruvate sulfurtransferase